MESNGDPTPAKRSMEPVISRFQFVCEQASQIRIR
jgi:hypothetical protein